MIEAAADGSSLGNPGPAGWGWFVDDGRWACGGWPRGTNNMGELMAVLDLLRQSADDPQDLRIFCDSKYVIDAVTTWMPGWKRRGWRKADGSPVLNLDLIQPIDVLMAARKAAGRRVDFVWVKGHAGHRLNEQADRLANGAAAAYQAGQLPDPGPGWQAHPSDGMPRPAPAPASEPARPDSDRPAQLDLFAEPEPATSHADQQTNEQLGQQTDEQIVVELERSLLTSAVRGSRHALEALLHPQWCEFGSSGRVLSRAETVLGLGPVDVQLEVVDTTRLGADAILLLWRAVGPQRTSLRSSVWVRVDGRWQQRFHQGTAAS